MPKLSLVEPSRPDLTPPASLSLDTKAARRALRAIDVAPEQFDALDDMELVSTFHEALGVGLRMLADCSLARAEIEGERGDWMWVIGVRVQDQLVNYRIPLGEEDPFSLFTLSQLISKIEAHVHA